MENGEESGYTNCLGGECGLISPTWRICSTALPPTTTQLLYVRPWYVPGGLARRLSRGGSGRSLYCNTFRLRTCRERREFVREHLRLQVFRLKRRWRWLPTQNEGWRNKAIPSFWHAVDSSRNVNDYGNRKTQSQYRKFLTWWKDGGKRPPSSFIFRFVERIPHGFLLYRMAYLLGLARSNRSYDTYNFKILMTNLIWIHAISHQISFCQSESSHSMRISGNHSRVSRIRRMNLEFLSRYLEAERPSIS